MKKYRNYYKNKSGEEVINEFSDCNNAFNDIQKMRDNGNSFIKTEYLKDNKWIRIFLETPTGI